ncbi:MAG: class I SAM-dependent methyltransferase [Thiothrix sp.]|nr:class I SAM-dependent methyltransferase [Thiothrix sp.]HPQ94215.1 class I SAM-dependent methyltransferase [Thiolinea sp.]
MDTPGPVVGGDAIPACPLCHGSTDFYWADRVRHYFQCCCCQLVFADPATRLGPAAERRVYELHRNSAEDAGYRRFLMRLVEPLTQRLGIDAGKGSADGATLQGLDFGCGPGPALSVLLEARGCCMQLYDPFFAPDRRVLAARYDFITCTEVVEHLYTPAREWALLLQGLKPGGWLGIMTKLVLDREAFVHWHYKNDPTHVSFFSRPTFRFLAARDGLMPEFVGRDVILLRKPL